MDEVLQNQINLLFFILKSMEEYHLSNDFQLK
jgi:hypothetical protein